MHEFLKKAVGPLVGYTQIPWTRVVMNRETLAWVRQLDTGRMDALEISGDYWKNKVPLRTYRTAWYPEYDVCDKPLPEQFDLVFAEQVFEHLLHPARAARNAFHMLRAGGYVLVTAPFLFRCCNSSRRHRSSCRSVRRSGVKCPTTADGSSGFAR